MINEIYIIEAQSASGKWTPMTLHLTSEDAHSAIEERHAAEGRYQIVYRIRGYIPVTDLKIYTDFIRKALKKTGMSIQLIENVLLELQMKTLTLAINIKDTKTGRSGSRPIVPGLRYFDCECGFTWESECRDKATPSGESCPKCKTHVYPGGRDA